MSYKLGFCLIAIIFSCSAYAGTANYCHDPKSAKEWEQMIVKYRELPELKELYSLRKSLCRQVDDGSITLNEAIDLFERERALTVRQLKRKLHKDYNNHRYEEDSLLG